MTTILKSIGSAAGRDYATPELWWASIPADVGASGNIYIGEMYKDSEFVSTTRVEWGDKKTTAGSYIELRAAAGQSNKDAVDINDVAYCYNPAKGVAWRFMTPMFTGFEAITPYLRLNGIQILANGGSSSGIVYIDAPGGQVENCSMTLGATSGGGASSGVVMMSLDFARNLTLVNLATSAVDLFADFGSLESTKLSNITMVNAVGAQCNGALYPSDDVTYANFAFFGFTQPFYASAVSTLLNCVTDADFKVMRDAGSTLTNCIEGAVLADTFMDTRTSTLDLRTKATSALAGNGTMYDSTNLMTVNGQRIKGTTIDVGSWETAYASVVSNGGSSGHPDSGSGSTAPTIMPGASQNIAGDPTKVISSIGRAPGRDYATIQAWITSIPQDVVAAGKSYIGQVCNDGEIVLPSTEYGSPAIQLGGKNCNANFNITLEAAPGASFRDNANFWTNRYAYVAANGAAIRVQGNYAKAIVTSNFTKIRRLQFRMEGGNQHIFCDDQYGDSVSFTDNIIEHTCGANFPFRLGKNGKICYNLVIDGGNGNSCSVAVFFGGATVVGNTIVAASQNGTIGSPGFYLAYGNGTVTNNAIFGFKATGNIGSNNALGHGEDAGDRVAGATGNLFAVPYRAQFVRTNTNNDTHDFRLRTGSLMIGAGAAYTGMDSERPQIVLNATPVIGSFEPRLDLLAPTVDAIQKVVSSIGSAAGRSFKTPELWWASIPTDIVTDGRIYVGEMYNDTEFYSATTAKFDGKIANDDFYIELKPAAGQGFMDNVNILATPLRYNQANGVAWKTAQTYNYGLLFLQKYMRVSGIQQQHVGTGSGTVGFGFSCPNGQVENIYVEAVNLDGSYCSVANVSDGHKFARNLMFATYGSGNIGYIWNGPGTFGAVENVTLVCVNGTASYGISCNDNGILNNFAILGAVNPVNFAGRAVVLNNLVTDKAIDVGSDGRYTANNCKFNATLASQFVDSAYATRDFRTKKGAATIDAGKTPSATNLKTLSGARVMGDKVDSGAWEAPLFPATKFVLTAPAQGTIGYTVKIRVTTDSTLLPGQTHTAVMSGVSGATFEPASVTISSDVRFVDVVATLPEVLGVSTITAHETGTGALADGTVNYTQNPPQPPTAVALTSLDANVIKDQAITITVGSDYPMRVGDSVVVTPTANIPGVFVPSSVTLTRTQASVDVKFTPSTSGSFIVTGKSVGSPTLTNGSIALSALPIPPVLVTGTNTYEVGIGHQFTTLAAFASWINPKDLIANKAKCFVQIFEDQTVTGLNMIPVSNDDYNVTLMPAPGFSFRSKATSGIYAYPNAGVELYWRGNNYVHRATWMLEMRHRFTDGATVEFQRQNGLGTGRLENNRVMSTNAGTGYHFSWGESFTPVDVLNNIFMRTTLGLVISSRDSNGRVLGNTFVKSIFAVGGYGQSNVVYQNNLLIDCGDYPVNYDTNSTDPRYFNVNSFKDNFANQTINPTYARIAAGITVDAVNSVVMDKVNDLRPVKDGLAYKKGNLLVKSTNDSAGFNRGLFPDAGALQLEPGTTLPITTLDSQVVKGQSAEFTFSVINEVTSVTATMAPAPGNNGGAVMQFKAECDFTTKPGKIYVRFPATPPGTYSAPIVTVTNTGGSTLAIGQAGVTIIAIISKAITSAFVGIADAVMATGKLMLPLVAGSDASIDTTKPQVALMSSSYNVRAAGIVTLTALASDNVGIAKVEFYKGAVKVGEDITSPYTLELPLGNADNGTFAYTAKAIDTSGNSAVSAEVSVVVAVPPSNATTPSVLSVKGYPNDNIWGNPHLVIEFSEPMDMTRQYSTIRPAHYALTNHPVVAGGAWIDSTHRVINLNFMFPIAASEGLSFSYRKDNQYGLRSANGVPLQSFTRDVENTVKSPKPMLVETFDGFAANASLAGKIGSTATINDMVWPVSTLFKSDGSAGMVPDTATAIANRAVNGFVPLASFVQPTVNVGGYGKSGTGMAVFFKPTAANDSALSILFEGAAINKAAPVNAMCTQGVLASVSRGGSVSFESIVPSGTARRWPTLQSTAALVAGQEYCLELCSTRAGNGLGYAVRLWASTAGVRTTLLAAGSYVNNVGGGNIMQIGAIIPAGSSNTAAATMTRFESLILDTEAFSGPLINPISRAPEKSQLVGLSNITEKLVDSVYTYAGNGAGVGVTPSGEFIKQFNAAENMAGIKITADTAATWLGFSFSKDGTRELAKPVSDLFFAVHVPLVGSYYEVYVDGLQRTAPRYVIATAGDILVLRQANNSMTAEVSHDDGVSWTVIYSWDTYSTYSYALAQLILPKLSTVAAVYN